MRRLRPWALLVVLYVGDDVLDPSVPGIFFFDYDQLFLDSAIQMKPTFAPLPPGHTPPRAGSRWMPSEQRSEADPPVMHVSSAGPPRWVAPRRLPHARPPSPSPDDH